MLNSDLLGMCSKVKSANCATDAAAVESDDTERVLPDRCPVGENDQDRLERCIDGRAESGVPGRLRRTPPDIALGHRSLAPFGSMKGAKYGTAGGNRIVN